VSVKKTHEKQTQTEEIFLAGGCLWGVQEFVRHLPGVVLTEAGRINGRTNSLDGDYDGYAECVRTFFDPRVVSIKQLMNYFFEIIDPYSINQQVENVGEKYRTGVYSCDSSHLDRVRDFINGREDSSRIMVEVKTVLNYLRSADEHQNRITLNPDEKCHIPQNLLVKYREY
jgi:peptide-methionine (S)-S-oxide reductase